MMMVTILSGFSIFSKKDSLYLHVFDDHEEYERYLIGSI